jgi:hypothetical protein
MDQRNVPDMSLEKSILAGLDLTDEQRTGVTKFMDAMEGLRDIEDIELGEEDDNPLPANNKIYINEPQVNSLMCVMDEFLNSYILVGYDVGGNRVNCFSFPSEMAADAGLTNIITTVETCRSMIREGVLSSDDNE